MTTLHKKLSEIRELQAEELDLVGGASEFPGGGSPTSCHVPQVYNTKSATPGGGHGIDDSHVDYWTMTDDTI